MARPLLRRPRAVGGCGGPAVAHAGAGGLRIATVVPGNVQTPRQERWHTPEGAAEIVAALCLDGRIQPADVATPGLFPASEDARMCTGHASFIDAGWH